MAESITLDTLMQSSGHTALQVQKPASVEAVTRTEIPKDDDSSSGGSSTHTSSSGSTHGGGGGSF